MKVISVFNNKGGVGKTTLTFHIANALASMGKKILLIDTDPQCNLTIYSLKEDVIHNIWEQEDNFIEAGFEETVKTLSPTELKAILSQPRSLHFLLKPIEEGTGDIEEFPPPFSLNHLLDIIPGRLTLHSYEERIAARWSDIYRADMLAIKTVTRIRALAELYTHKYGYDYVIIDTSPSLGILNKTIISTVDGIFVPAFPDFFSLYGIRNIGKALSSWSEEFSLLYSLISKEKRSLFPDNFVRFLGYTIYNAKPYSGSNTKWQLAQAHLNYVEKIPDYIRDYISPNIRDNLSESQIVEPIGKTAIMHSHNTFPAMAQHYHSPMWKVPGLGTIEPQHVDTLRGARSQYEETLNAYRIFCTDLMTRIETLG